MSKVINKIDIKPINRKYERGVLKQLSAFPKRPNEKLNYAKKNLSANLDPTVKNSHAKRLI
ncbi:hypothetical protein [Pedobacter sp. SYSU D00535]|uniref:hypothetical protein n=1 Tax=Pedobacter sp. SYSU D00535 TaxID=2810308 RepID=UPI001A956BAC|nr:hypothetical protein [Pedobacter sp. SYSU D00535]